MTENKRFVYIEHKGADYILDTPNWELDFIEMLGDTLEAEEIVDLLNEQHETIQQLKQDKQQLYRTESKLRVRIKILQQFEQKVKETLQKHYNLTKKTKDYHIAMILEALANELGVVLE